MPSIWRKKWDDCWNCAMASWFRSHLIKTPRARRGKLGRTARRDEGEYLRSSTEEQQSQTAQIGPAPQGLGVFGRGTSLFVGQRATADYSQAVRKHLTPRAPSQ